MQHWARSGGHRMLAFLDWTGDPDACGKVAFERAEDGT